MDVLLISAKTKDSKGGIAVWTEHYLNGCRDKGISCDVVNTARIGKNAANMTGKRSVIDEFIRTRGIFRQLKKQLKEKTYQVAHLNTSIGFFGVIRDYYIAKKISKKHIPIALHFHCDIPYWSKRSIIKKYLKKIVSLASVCFVLCENSKKYLCDICGVTSAKVPNFISDIMIADKKNISPEIKNVLFTGRVSIPKGANEIFEIAESFPNLNFNLIGEISAEIFAREKPDNINLLGTMEHSDVLKMLDKNDLFLFPSHSEGFSMALAEAMARGVPSIATDVGAGFDMLEDKGGIVVECGDVEAMKNAMERISSCEMRQEMSAWCIRKVRNCYTTDKVMDLFVEQYKSIRKVT